MTVGRALAAAVLSALALAGAASARADSPPARGGYAGTVPGTRAYVALVIGRNGAVTGYVSDGRKVARWLRGRAAATSFVLGDGRARLRARVTRGRATGAVRLGGRDRPFAALPARRPAGLYRARRTARGKVYVGGWIVLPDGRQRGAVRVGSRVVAAPLVHPAAAGGVRVAGVRLAPRYVR